MMYYNHGWQGSVFIDLNIYSLKMGNLLPHVKHAMGNKSSSALPKHAAKT